MSILTHDLIFKIMIRYKNSDQILQITLKEAIILIIVIIDYSISAYSELYSKYITLILQGSLQRHVSCMHVLP